MAFLEHDTSKITWVGKDVLAKQLSYYEMVEPIPDDFPVPDVHFRAYDESIDRYRESQFGQLWRSRRESPDEPTD